MSCSRPCGSRLLALQRGAQRNALVVLSPPAACSGGRPSCQPPPRAPLSRAPSLLRRAELICQDGIGNSISHLDRASTNASARKFPRCWNGCWDNKRVEHFCAGDCGPLGTDDECRRALFSTCVECDILCGLETNAVQMSGVPAPIAAAKSVLGFSAIKYCLNASICL